MALLTLTPSPDEVFQAIKAYYDKDFDFTSLKVNVKNGDKERTFDLKDVTFIVEGELAARSSRLIQLDPEE